VLPVADIDSVVPFEIIDGEISVGGPPDAWAATARTCRYLLDQSSIRFIEVS
jgi:hypothetical protein